MFRNQYDTDITTYSPQGRLHQVEYAMEAVKQGSAVVGIRSATHCVLATLKRSASELAANQNKLLLIDDHLGVAIAGLTSDARVLSKFMRTECLNHKYVYDSPMPVGRLVLDVADKCQVSTQRASKRPYGVGLLVVGYDATGPHLYQTCPSGNYYEYLAMAIGARSQSAKTYLERAVLGSSSGTAAAPAADAAAAPAAIPAAAAGGSASKVDGASLEELCDHALRALRETVAAARDSELNTKNCAIAVVGKDTPFKVIEGDAVQAYLDRLDAEVAAAPAAPAGGEAAPAPDAAEGGDAAMQD